LIALSYSIVAAVTVFVMLRLRGWGHNLQAVAADADLAETVFGLSRSRVEWTTAAAVAIILAPAGLFYAAGHGVTPTTGTDMSLLAFVAAIVAGRSRPIGAVLVVILLVAVRSVSIRWPLSQFILVVAGGAAMVVALRAHWVACTRVATIATVACAVCVVALVCLRWYPLDTLSFFTMPSAFQDVAPYIFIVGWLLIKPRLGHLLWPERRV